MIVEETHRRGLVAETHATSLEGLRLSVLAGIDLIQHPDNVGNRTITDELLDLIVERGIVCSMLINQFTGPSWQFHVRNMERAREDLAEAEAGERQRRIPPTTAEIRRRVQDTGLPQPGSVMEGRWTTKRTNAKKLIEAGCIVTVGTDNTLFGRGGVAADFLREEPENMEHQLPGLGTIFAIEGLVELGMTPSEAIVAATKNGAIASKALDEYGTLEVGKAADIVVLDVDPLADISNIRRLTGDRARSGPGHCHVTRAASSISSFLTFLSLVAYRSQRAQLDLCAAKHPHGRGEEASVHVETGENPLVRRAGSRWSPDLSDDRAVRCPRKPAFGAARPP